MLNCFSSKGLIILIQLHLEAGAADRVTEFSGGLIKRIMSERGSS